MRFVISAAQIAVGMTFMLPFAFRRTSVLFGVPVSPSFLASADARSAIQSYRKRVILAMAVSIALAWLLPVGLVAVLVPLAVLL